MFVAALKLLSASDVPFLVGGAYAFERYTGIARHTRDLDLFVRPDDAPRVLEMFAEQGFRTELTFPHWLGKVYKGRTYVDVIFSSGNAIARVDDSWFAHALSERVLRVPVRLVPAEEMIWSKAFIMERERFDGADILHLLLEYSPQLDWKRLLDRFDTHRLVLLGHLTLFAYVYPTEGWRIPSWVWERLLADLDRERVGSHAATRLCRGTLLSRSQYLDDIERGFRDVRLPPDGDISPHDLATWTEAAAGEDRSGVPEAKVTEHAQHLRERSATRNGANGGKPGPRRDG